MKFIFITPSWGTLKVIGASFLSTFTIAVPFLGYLIFYGSISDGVYSFDFGQWPSTEPFLINEFSFIRLKLTYVGLAIIGFTTIVFRIFCPYEIANHKGESSFIISAISTSHNDSYKRQLNKMQNPLWYDFAIPGRNGLDTIKIEATRMSSAPDTRPTANVLRRSEWLEKNTDGLNAVFSVQYQKANYSWCILRFILIFGYAAGFLLTLIPSMQFFYPIFMEVINFLCN